MKNARQYEKKLKKLLATVGKSRVEPVEDVDPIAVAVEAILESDSTTTAAARAFKAVMDEFVDYNELRVAPPRDIVGCIDKDYSRALERAQMMTGFLCGLYNRTSEVSTGYMHKMTKRDLRRHLAELGLDAYAAAAMMLKVFGAHAIPVDRDLVDTLKMKALAHPDADDDEVRGFLERVIPQKDALAAHLFFRDYVQQSAKELAKKRKAEAKAAARAAEAAARAIAAQEKAEAEKAKAKKAKARKAKAKKAKAEKAKAKKAKARKARKPKAAKGTRRSKAPKRKAPKKKTATRKSEAKTRKKR